MSAARPTISVGVFAHNEEATLEACVDSILEQRIGGTLLEVLIVSSGSSDATDSIAQRLAGRDPRVRVLPEPRRDGKARAINRYLSHAVRADRVALVSADVVLADGALDLLLAPFVDPSVGMTGGRPMPQNERRGVGRLVHLLWDLHDAVARRSPKLGEAVVLRAPVAPIPETTSADEAALEADIVQRRRLRLVYRPQAILHNRGPETIADWIEHRRRIARAHAEIEATGYRPATRDLACVLRGALAHAVERPKSAPLLAVAAFIEAWAWIAGSLDARVVEQTPRGTWKPIESAKRPIARVASPPP